MFLATVWKESIIGNKELVIHLTRTFHLSLSQRHSCLILWTAVAQQTCRILIVKWILLVFFFPLLFQLKCMQWVWRHFAHSQMSAIGMVHTVFFFFFLLAWTKFSAVQQGMRLRESRQWALYSNVLDRLLLQLLTQSREDYNCPLEGQLIQFTCDYGELFRGVCRKV